METFNYNIFKNQFNKRADKGKNHGINIRDKKPRASIKQLEKKIEFERPTLSKYLLTREARRMIYHKLYGKAKVRFINKAA